MRPGDGPPGLVGTALRRHWRWVLAITAGVGLVLALVLANLEALSYHRTGAYVVGSATGADPDGALVSANTDRAARDYAAVLREDELLLRELGTVVGRSADGVRDRLQAAYVPAASVIKVRYQGDSAAEVRALFGELDRRVRTDGIASSNFPPGAVRPLQDDATVVTTVDPLRAHPAWGLLGGLALGLAAAVGIERAHPRVAGRAHLQTLTRRPVVDLRGAADGGLLATRLLRADPAPTRIVVTSSDAGAASSAAEVADRLRAGLDALGATATVVSAAAGPSPTPGGDAQATVLVVRERERVARLAAGLGRGGDGGLVVALVDAPTEAAR